MAVTTRIHCLTDAEPPSFHGTDGDPKAYAVNLNIECETADPIDDAARDQAHATFKLFLEKAATAEFYLFKATFGVLAGKTGVKSLDLLYKIGGGAGQGEVISEPGTLASAPLLTWLDEGAAKRRDDAFSSSTKPTEPEKQADAAAAERRYWLVASGVNEGRGVDQADIGATHELRSAHAWNAPVAHRFGLTKLLLLPLTDDELKENGIFYLVLPSVDGAAPVPVVAMIAPFDGAEPPDTIDIPYDLNAGFLAPTVCRATRLLLPPTDFPGLVAPDGFLKVDEQPDQVRRLLNWFEQSAVTLMSPAPGLARNETKDGRSVQTLFEPIWVKVEEDHKIIYKLDAFKAAWRLVSTLCVALDPMIVGLMRPAVAPAGPVTFDPRPEGQILSVLVSSILQQLDRLRTTDSAAFPAGKLPDEQVISGALRDFLQGSGLFSADRQKLSEALAYIHGIARPQGGSSADDVMLDVLLRCFNDGPDQLHLPTEEEKKTIAKKIDPKTGPEGFGPDALAAAVASEKKLHEEAGFEAAILRFFESAAAKPTAGPQPPLATLVADQITKLIADKAGLDASRIGTLVAKAWQAFRSTLDGAFNGAEAARRSAGSDFLTALLGPQAGTPLKTAGNKVKELIKLIDEGSSFSASLFKDGSGCFAAILSGVPRPVAPDEIKENQIFLDILREAHADALAPLQEFATDNPAEPRFVPDNVPHPLPVQIAESLTPADVDQFAHHFNGIAVGIRRKENDTSPFVHLNLASLTWTRVKVEDADNPGKFKFTFADVPDENNAIHPFLPASVDGRSAVFLNYEGFPFASTAFSETVPHGEGEASSVRRPFYIHDVADYSHASPEKRPPQLAYGRAFEAFSFVATNSGSLPKVLARSQSTPWRPADDINAAKIKADVISTANYQRRTAIGRIALEEVSGNKGGVGNQRIGAPLPGVYPLANDYPRLVLAANSSAAPGALDLMRLADGSGGFLFPTDVGEARRNKLGIADPDWLGGKGKLTIGLFTSPTRLDTPADFKIPDVPGAGPGFNGTGELFLSVEMKSKGADKNIYVLSLYVDTTLLGQSSDTELPSAIDRGWFRFTLTPDENKPVAFSFAEPEAQGGAGHGVRDTALLLLAPDKTRWKSGLSETVKAKITSPRTGFIDFERWFANADLQADVFSASPKKQLFLDALLTAYVMRHRDKDLAESLSNLPDPSVIAMRVTLTVTDGLGDQPTIMQQKDVELSRLLPLVVTNIPSDDTEDGVPVRKAPWTIGDLKKSIFDRLRNKFTFEVAVSPGTLSLDVVVDDTDDVDDKGVETLGGKISVQVPPGVVAQLSIAPLVEARHFDKPLGTTFPPVFYSGMLQYVTASYGKTIALPATLAFPETGLRIETMIDVLVDRPRATDLARRMIRVTPVESARRYDLTALGDRKAVPQPADRNDWRMVGEIDITAQRWRVTGRPIYHHVNPREFRADGMKKDEPVAHPALGVKNPEHDALSVFETEAFFDRLNLDADTVTQRLLPLPSNTVLQTFPWDSPSATYFRHHFALRSRYAGALAGQGRQTVPAWPTPDLKNPDPLKEWTLRVAMLADHSRLMVTRPQLRALIPLTASTGIASITQSTPPILAVLQEPPFARAGLADRVCAEISTGFGYGFDEPLPPVAGQEKVVERVHIRDSRKEVGPDPRLTYRAMPLDLALGLALRAEGPMGLTFDQPNAPAPAFANSLLSLMPVSVSEDKQPVLEEHFMGVALRRYFDPNWTTTNPVQTGERVRLDPEQTVWIELPKSACSYGGGAFVVSLEFRKPHEVDNIPMVENFLTVIDAKETPARVIRIPKIMLDPVPARADDQEVVVARFVAEQIAGLVLLHQPVAPKRYSTSILGIPRQGSQNAGDSGQNAQPLVLASFEWSPRTIVYTPPQPESEEISDAIILLPEATVWPGMASARTFLAWTRTGLDHDRGRKFKIDPDTAQTILETEAIEFNGLEARIDANNVFSLRKGNTEGGTPVWATSSTFVEHSFPVHLHRHLAVISTHFADGAGRPVEVFSRADLVRAVTTGFNKLKYAKPISCCRIIEFETPAMILTGTPSPLIPKTYATAYFDLQSTGFANGPIELFFRFVGSADHLRKFDSLELTLTKMDGSLQTFSVALAGPKGRFALGLRLGLTKDATNASRLDSNGNLSLLPLKGWVPDGLGFIAAITAKEKGGTTTPGLEFWADVSLLHSNDAGASGDFNFDWLFSRSNTADPVDAVRPQALAAMTEVQARIVSVSPPIPVTAI
jgi:hypothetical protein